MTTKEQERKALAKIREIVAGLGENSYVGTALTGCLEDAEENIECDFALSMYDRWQSSEQKLEEAQTALSEVADKLIDEGKRADEAERIANNKIESADRWCTKYHDAHDKLCDALADVSARDAEIQTLEAEIIGLKAKLYDMMTAGA